MKDIPYGTKPQAEVRKFVLKLVNISKSILKLMVIACNTATAAALAMAKKRIIYSSTRGIYPGAQAAVTIQNAHTIE